MILPLTGQPVPPEKVQGAIEELNVVLKQFEEKFLQDKPFIAGSEVSLADLVAVVELMQVSINPSLWDANAGLGQTRRSGDCCTTSLSRQVFVPALNSLAQLNFVPF